MSINKNGCHNRPPLSNTAIVQSEWFEEWSFMADEMTRTPLMIEITDPMTKDCQYQKLKKDDPKCAGCKHLEN